MKRLVALSVLSLVLVPAPAYADETTPCEPTEEVQIEMGEVAPPTILIIPQDIQPDVIEYGPAYYENNLVNDLIKAEETIVRLKAKIKKLRQR